MAERAAVYQATQLGDEATAGVVVPADKRMLCTMLEPSPNIPTTVYRPAGSVAPTSVVQAKEWTEGEYSGALCPNDLIYILNSILLTGTITTPAGATNTRRHTFTPSNFAPDAYKTYTVEKGSSAGAERMAHTVFNSLTMRWTRDAEAAVNGGILGQALSEQITLTAAPTDLGAAPIDPDAVSIFIGSSLSTNEVKTITITGTPTGGTFTLTYEGQTTAAIAFNANAAAVQAALEALSTIGVGNVLVAGGPGPGTPWTVTFQGLFAGIDASEMTDDDALLTGGTTPAVAVTTTTPAGMTRLLRASEFEFAIPDSFAPVMTLNAATPSFDALVRQGIEPTAQIVMMHDAASAAYMADLRAKTTRYCRVIATGQPIESGWRQSVKLTFAFVFVNSDRGDNDAIYANTYDLRPIYDATLGSWVSVVVDNAIASL